MTETSPANPKGFVIYQFPKLPTEGKCLCHAVTLFSSGLNYPLSGKLPGKPHTHSRCGKDDYSTLAQYGFDLFESVRRRCRRFIFLQFPITRSAFVNAYGWISSFSTKSPPAPAVATTSSEIAQRPQTAAPDAATAHHSAEQPPAKQEQTSPNIAAAPNIRSKASSPPHHARAKRTPVPETRPTTIEGWMLREVTDGSAVLEGPNGTWTVRRGDTVPGVGRVESIVLWGKRWIVATSKGLISTP